MSNIVTERNRDSNQSLNLPPQISTNTIAFDITKEEAFTLDRNFKSLYKRLKAAWKVIKYDIYILFISCFFKLSSLISH